MSYIYVAATWLLYAVATVLSLCGLVVARFYLFDGKSKLDKCGLYMGQVSHTRLKGNASDEFHVLAHIMHSRLLILQIQPPLCALYTT